VSEDEELREAHGWTAIERAVERVLPDREPMRWELPEDAGGLVGLLAYRGEGYWLIVSLGLTELFEKVTDDPVVSGWGVELTLRVPAGDEELPPNWALNLVMKLGAYVFGSGSAFGPGHRMDPGGPITGAADTRLTALAFDLDPRLGGVDTPNGRVEFLTVVGITRAELDRMKRSSTEAVLEELAAASPLLITDPRR
jgi:hypothetical protein